MGDWKIRKKEDACAQCERPFEEGEPHFSILQATAESLGREDRCDACFEAAGDTGDGIFWRTRRRERKRGLAVDFDSIERLFLALEDRPEERLRELRYLLSLLLLRKKRLKLVRVRRSSEAERMVVRRPRRSEELEVDVFDLSPERTALLRAELERIFEGAGAEDLALPETGETGAEGGAEPTAPAAEPAPAPLGGGEPEGERAPG